MNTYGIHSIHGRAPAIATGLELARPDLSVWVVTGDGDALSIGGNHLIHALRRNVNVKILMFNNQIYGLTKGQYSPTSPLGTVTSRRRWARWTGRSTRWRSRSAPRRRFVARTSTSTARTCPRRCARAAEHKGTAFVEIYQNCNIFNDGAFDAVRERRRTGSGSSTASRSRFGAEDERGVRLRPDGSAEIVEVADAGEDSLLAIRERNQGYTT